MSIKKDFFAPLASGLGINTINNICSYASASANTLTIKGPATEESIRKAVEGIGYTFKGKA